VDTVDVLPDDVEVAFPLAELSADVMQLLQRWRPAADLLGGPTTVIGVYPGAVPGRLRGLHSLIDGHRTVAELTEASGHGEIGTVVDLADLIEARCAVPISGPMGAVEQRLAMLAALEHPSEPERSRPSQPNLSVIPGGAAQAEPVEEDDLLATILKGVRGV
jgi:hypothetical protein